MSSLPEGRKALVVAFGKDQEDAIERCVEITSQTAPDPSQLSPGDIIVRVVATEIVWTDTLMATGQYQHRPRLPYSPGMVYSGVVVHVTPEAAAKGVAVGARVTVSGDAGPRSKGRYQQFGGCATYAVAPVTAVRAVPPSWSFAQAACATYGYDTAFHALVECGRIGPGETILIHGAAGGVGIPAVCLAVVHGAKVIATTRSSAKVEFLRSIGAAHVIVLENDDSADGALPQSIKPFAKAVKALTGGRGCDVVYDGVGGADITIESMRALAYGGRLLIVGWAATPNVGGGGGNGARKAARPNTVPTNLIMMKGLKVIGCPAVIATYADRTVLPRRVKALTEWAMQGKLPPPTVGRVYALDDVKAALRERANSGSGPVGSTVVCPSGDIREATLSTSKL